MSEIFDVLVIGGGPAGSTAAALCAQRGLRTALLERKKFPRHKVCGDVINPNCWPVLEHLGVADQIRALPRHNITGAWFTSPGGQAVDVAVSGEMVAIRRSLFDSCLLDHARSSGVIVIEGATFHEIEPRWRVGTRTAQFHAHSVIGADGRHSMVASKTALARPPRNSTGHVAFQAHFHAPAAMDDRVHIHLFPGGYCGIVRIDDTRVNLCIVTDNESARVPDNCEALFSRTVWQNPFFRALGVLPDPIEPIQSAHPLWLPMNLAARSDGVILVGDALKTVEPFTGQGIFFGLRTAALAAEHIGHPLRYAQEVRTLHRHRGKTNALLRDLLYRQRAAGLFLHALRQWPGMLRWLAHSVLAEQDAPTTIASS